MNPGKPYTLEYLKQWHYDLINSYRDEKINGGFTFDGHIYDSDLNARMNIQGATTLALAVSSQGQDFPPEFTWRTKDNQNISHNAASIINMAIAYGAFLSTQYDVSWYDIDQGAALNDMQTLLDYDITTGWM